MSKRGSTSAWRRTPFTVQAMHPQRAATSIPSTGSIRRRGFWRAGPTRRTLGRWWLLSCTCILGREGRDVQPFGASHGLRGPGGDPRHRIVHRFGKPKVGVRGWDLAGQVEAVGSVATGFQSGDEVMGIAEGSFAKLAIASPDKLVPKPARLTMEQAAAVPISGVTALQALRDKAGMRPGHKLLIIGAAGGVGSLAVQLAKAFGAEVTGVCSTTKMDLVRSIGADQAIDYTREDFADGQRRWGGDRRYGGPPAVGTTSPCPHPQGDPGDRRRRRRWAMDQGLFPRGPPGASAVAVCGSEAVRVEREGESGGPADRW